MRLFAIYRIVAGTDTERLRNVVIIWSLCVVCMIAPRLEIFSQPPTERSNELVHYGDLIDVDVLGGFEFDWRGTLSPEGFLDGLNSFGDPIYGLCRSEKDIAADVTRAFSKFLRDPQVVVRVIDRSNRAVATIDGAIRFPQRFQLRRPANLRELIALSGGITDAAGGEIQIMRPRNLSCEQFDKDSSAKVSLAKSGERDNGLQILNIAIKNLLSGVNESNPDIRSGDIITIALASPIYLIGGVNNPRQYPLRGSIPLTKALAAAGGLTKQADETRITIYRRDGRETRMIEADLTKIASGSLADPQLKPFDIVDVSEKGRGKRTYPPVVTNPRADGARTLPLRIIEQ